MMLFVPFTGRSNDDFFNNGLDQLLNKDYVGAKQSFLKDIEQQASYSAFYNYGVAAGELEQWHEAKWAFESALKYKPLDSDGQYNARYVTHQLSDEKIWVHPYPWLERVVLGFGSSTWWFLALVSSVFLGLLIFNIISKKSSKMQKWCWRLSFPALLIFGISFYGVYSINQHYEQERYAIIKDNTTEFYISPNGVQIQENLDPANRLSVVKYFKDSTWVQIKSEGNNHLWVEASNLLTY